MRQTLNLRGLHKIARSSVVFASGAMLGSGQWLQIVCDRVPTRKRTAGEWRKKRFAWSPQHALQQITSHRCTRAPTCLRKVVLENGFYTSMQLCAATKRNQFRADVTTDRSRASHLHHDSHSIAVCVAGVFYTSRIAGVLRQSRHCCSADGASSWASLHSGEKFLDLVIQNLLRGMGGQNCSSTPEEFPQRLHKVVRLCKAKLHP